MIKSDDEALQAAIKEITRLERDNRELLIKLNGISYLAYLLCTEKVEVPFNSLASD